MKIICPKCDNELIDEIDPENDFAFHCQDCDQNFFKFEVKIVPLNNNEFSFLYKNGRSHWAMNFNFIHAFVDCDLDRVRASTMLEF